MLSKIDLLEKLAQLRRANLLTDEEYEAQKKQILAEASGLHEPAGSTAAQAGEQAVRRRRNRKTLRATQTGQAISIQRAIRRHRC